MSDAVGRSENTLPYEETTSVNVAGFSGRASGFEVVSTPTPVRRAIPVAPESRPHKGRPETEIAGRSNCRCSYHVSPRATFTPRC